MQKIYMEIQKIFSSMEDDEKLYSVLMSEEEFRAFARKDYEGLTRNQQVNLHARRSEYAKALNEARNTRNSSLGQVKDLLNVHDGVKLTDVVEGGGITTTNRVSTNIRAGETALQSAKRAVTAQKNQMLSGSKQASELMRKEVIEGIGPEASQEARAKAHKFLNQSDPTRKLKIKTTGVDPLSKPIQERLSDAKTSGILNKPKAQEVAKKNLGKNRKIGLAVAGGTALAGLGAAAYLRNKKKKEKD